MNQSKNGHKDKDGYGIALQPICDRQLQHIGDKLLYRDSAKAQTANVEDALLATARASASVVFDIGLQELVGNRVLLCTIPDEWLREPAAILYPAEQTILEIPASAWQEPDTAAAVQALQQAGFRVAVEAHVLGSLEQSLPTPPDVIKTDFRKTQTPPTCPGSADTQPVQMATFIETSDQLEAARQAGFNWFQGFVFSLPVVIPKTTRKRSGNRAVELQLLATLGRDDFSVHELEPLLAQHPSLALVVLRQANSAAFARRGRTIDTLHEALMRIGLGRMRTLISTFMLTSNEPIRHLQARQLLIRAGLAANLAERIASVPPAVAFSVGLFSRLDAFEGLPMDDLVRDLPFSEAVRNALIHDEGELGKLIGLLDDFEAGKTNRFGETTITMLNEDYLRASAWADRWLRDDQDDQPAVADR